MHLGRRERVNAWFGSGLSRKHREKIITNRRSWLDRFGVVWRKNWPSYSRSYSEQNERNKRWWRFHAATRRKEFRLETKKPSVGSAEMLAIRAGRGQARRFLSTSAATKKQKLTPDVPLCHGRAEASAGTEKNGKNRAETRERGYEKRIRVYRSSRRLEKAGTKENQPVERGWKRLMRKRREKSKDVARSYRYRVDAAVNKQRDETRMKETEKEGRRERGKRKGQRKRGLGEGAPAWVCRRGGVTTVSPTQPLLRRFYPRPRLTDQPLQQLPRHFEFGSVQSSCTTLPLL